MCSRCCSRGLCFRFLIPSCGTFTDAILFSLRSIRFKVAPKTVIYDYACALATYCWRRELQFFKNTVFLIDELHWHGHSNCSSAFSAQQHMALSELVREYVLSLIRWSRSPRLACAELSTMPP